MSNDIDAIRERRQEWVAGELTPMEMLLDVDVLLAEIDRLKAERDNIQREWDDWALAHKDWIIERVTLQAELAEAREKIERLSYSASQFEDEGVLAERARITTGIEALPVAIVNVAPSPDDPPRHERYIRLSSAIEVSKEESCPVPATEFHPDYDASKMALSELLVEYKRVVDELAALKGTQGGSGGELPICPKCGSVMMQFGDECWCPETHVVDTGGEPDWEEALLGGIVRNLYKRVTRIERRLDAVDIPEVI